MIQWAAKSRLSPPPARLVASDGPLAATILSPLASHRTNRYRMDLSSGRGSLLILSPQMASVECPNLCP
jgi:hypothetical protein